jgi:hypothetical protein
MPAGMNPFTPQSSINRSVVRVPRRASLLLSVTASVLVASVNVFAQVTNHPPSISWIKDQAITDQNNNQFDTVYFRAWDSETPLGTGNLSYVVENDLVARQGSSFNHSRTSHVPLVW